MLLLCRKGGDNMYYELNTRERKLFIKKHLDIHAEYIKDIKKISRISYGVVDEYMINNKYLIRMYK